MNNGRPLTPGTGSTGSDYIPLTREQFAGLSDLDKASIATREHLEDMGFAVSVDDGDNRTDWMLTQFGKLLLEAHKMFGGRFSDE